MNTAPLPDSALDRWKRVEPLLDAVLDLDPEHRGAFLDSACRGDLELRAELEALIAWCERGDGFLEHVGPSAFGALLAVQGFDPTGTRVGPFRILQSLGQGGMGTVYLADRADGQFEQRVALKLIRGVYSTSDYLIRRFLEERRILASLEHPRIARLIDGGVLPDGLPWFAMEYVEGLRIDRHCDQHRQSVEERLRLLLDVCDAVQYAHRSLVVHRDLKPSNILVTEDGLVKLLDFGIARLLTGREGTAHTRTALHPLTPDYSSPEQIRGEPVTTTTDVYSLGVILYELLSGVRPYRLAGKTPAEIERTVSLTEIKPPSEMIIAGGSDTATARATTPERLRRRLRGDLDTIALSALRKEPDRRYGSVEQLADDIRHHLEGRPVGARRDTIGYRTLRFVTRHRVGVAASAVILSLLIGTTVVTQVQSVRVARERDKAEQLSGFLIDLFAAPDPWYGGGAALTVGEMLDSGAARISRELATQPEIQADLLSMMGRSYSGLGLYDRARQLFDSALAASRRTGTSDARVSRDQMFLGMIALDTEDFVAAESLSRASLALRRQQVRAGSPDLTNPLLYLAEVLWRTGRPDQAEPLVREAVAIERSRRPPSVLRLAVSLNDLGHVRRELGDLTSAEAFYREALGLRLQVLGNDHPDVANLLINIARVRHPMGDTSAVWAMQRALDVKRKAFGEGHPEMAFDQAVLAGMQADIGALAVAESLYRASLAIQRRALRPGHTRTARTLLGLGEVLLARGETALAVPWLVEARASLRSAPWRDHARLRRVDSLLARAGLKDR